MSHTANALIFSHYHFRDSMKKQEYGKALRYFEIFLNAHDRLEASAKAHTQQQVTQHNEDKKMVEQNIQKSELISNGFKVSVSIIGDKVQVVIDDITTSADRGVTVIDMYHNDKYVRVVTQHIIRDIIRGGGGVKNYD